MDRIADAYCRRLPRLAFMLVLFVFMVPAICAQTPFVTDDADATEKGKFHFQFINEYDWLPSSALPTQKQNAADFELAYGLLDGVEIGIESPLLTLINEPGENPRRVSGIGDTNVSVKYNFYKEREHSKLPAMALVFNVELPTGDVERELGSGLADFYVNGILQKSMSSKTKLRLNGGILFSGNETTGVVGIKTRGTVFTAGASLVKQFSPKLQLGMELAGAMTRAFELEAGQMRATFGGNYQIRHNATLDFGFVIGKFAASPRMGLQGGFSIDF